MADDMWTFLSHAVTFITACKYSWSAFKVLREWFRNYKKTPPIKRRKLK